jgi:hypothetical protein
MEALNMILYLNKFIAEVFVPESLNIAQIYSWKPILKINPIPVTIPADFRQLG